ncbi:hypothetical protein KS4_15770 [Poriferisphaera corsica]|uniref:Uncharacterized protein n=1 Tax=Poriferisphaera corsica TaxID=2528020 RepID=A0A517YTG9_9BACT|nr:hypothetical protein [Poriferisphaera corsica]QDU33527.1 hypothetical protein KS4_15770 [Poriferisphaera corsica]
MENPEQSNPATLEGTTPPLTDDTMRRKAIDTAFDYRGDVTLTTSGGNAYKGYLYNRDDSASEPYAMMMLKAGGEQKIIYADITALTFSGKDPAAGKTWESWLKRYAEKKLKGEAANIESENLED